MFRINKDGIKIHTTKDGVDYDEYMIFGDEVLQMINYYEYFVDVSDFSGYSNAPHRFR
jgi:hypothetical protein